MTAYCCELQSNFYTLNGELRVALLEFNLKCSLKSFERILSLLNQ